MKYLDDNNLIYEMSKSNKAVISIEPGEIISVKTRDCFNNKLVKAGTTIEDADLFNPATGPIEIKGANIGDTLKIEIQKIEFDKIGINVVEDNFGFIKECASGMYIKRAEVFENNIKFNDKLYMNLHPMIGVIGVAAKNNPISTETPDIHGGNMDCTLITEKATLYLPVFTEGALLALGDLHACMGDGEVGGCGLEISGTVTLKVNLLKNTNIEYPIVIDDQNISVIASKRTIDEAAKTAAKYMNDFLFERTDLERNEIIALQSLAANLVICQTVNPNKTVRMSFPIKYAKKLGFEFY